MSSQSDDDVADRLEATLKRLRVPAFMASYSAGLLAALRTQSRLAKHLRTAAVRVPGDRTEALLVGTEVRRRPRPEPERPPEHHE
jgi:hypothetical protein